MTKEIERAGIPIVQVTNLTKIAEGIGSHRIMRGNSVLHVFGNPSLPKTQEIKFRKELSEKVVHMLEKVPEEREFSIIKEV